MTLKTHPRFLTFTLNPSDKWQYFGSSDRLEKVRNLLHEEVHLRLSAGAVKNTRIDYWYCLELSEPRVHDATQSGPRIHLHGIIGFPTMAAYRVWLLRYQYELTRFSRIEIDTIDDINVWIKYCRKQNYLKLGESCSWVDIDQFLENTAIIFGLIDSIDGAGAEINNIEDLHSSTE